MKHKHILSLGAILFVCIVLSCSLISKKLGQKKNQKEQINQLAEFLPVRPNVRYAYRVRFGERSLVRVLQWQGTAVHNGKTVHFFTDGKGFTKAYEFTEDAVLLRGISLENQITPYYYEGHNPCLKMPLVAGNKWSIDAVMKTPITKIHQTGMARILRLERCRVEAGEFDTVKVLFNVTSKYSVPQTGEESFIIAQYILWYGKGVGLLRQEGTALIEKENRTIELKQELIKFEPHKPQTSSSKNF